MAHCAAQCRLGRVAAGRPGPKCKDFLKPPSLLISALTTILLTVVVVVTATYLVLCNGL